MKNTKESQETTSTEQLLAEVNEVATEEASVETGGVISYKFVILEEEDYLTVYLSDRETVYEYTAIRYSDLEEELQKKIRDGYCVKDEKALFGFLENYSS